MPGIFLYSFFSKAVCNTVPVQYPNIAGVNVDTYRAAAYGAYAGDAVYGRGGYYGRGFGMGGDEVEEACKEGCRHGYGKDMREIHGDMGFRDGGRNYSGSGMGERRRRRANGESH